MRFDLGAVLDIASSFATSKFSGYAVAGVVSALALGGILSVWPADGEDEDVAEAVVVNGGPLFMPATFTGPKPAPAFAPARPSDTTTNAAALDDQSLTRAVQRRLKRAYCYSGPVNGAWNTPTRRGMAEFTRVVNARLPLDHPAPELLALLEAHDGMLCPSGCSRDDCAPREIAPGEQDVRKQRTERREEVAAVERQPAPEARRPVGADETVERREAAASREPAPETRTRASAADLGFDDEDQRAPNPIAAVQNASAAGDDAIGAEEAAGLAAAGVASHEATKKKPQRSARKYRKKNTFSRQVQRSFRQIQRSFGKLF